MTNKSRNAVLRAVSFSALFVSFFQSASAQNTLDRVGLTASTPATPAYSLRKLSSAYAGPAIRVRRSSDNALTDIGFTAGGDLDTTALKTFTGAANGFVATWYDQSGYAVNAVSRSNGTQPRIVYSGVVERLNGRPSLAFIQARLETGASVLYPNGVSMVAVAKGSDQMSSFVAKTGTAAGQNLSHPGPFDFANQFGDFLVGNAATATYNFISTWVTNPRSSIQSTVPASVYSFVIPGSSGTYYNYLNGVQAGSNTITAYSDGGNALVIGGRNDGGSTTGTIWTPEIVLFNFALSTTQRNTVEAAQKSYYISDDATLAALTVSSGALSPAFSAAGTAYSAPDATSITVTATVAGLGAVQQIRLNGGAYDSLVSGNVSTPLLLRAGINTVEIRVTAPSGTQKTYSISVRGLNNFDRLGLNAPNASVAAFSLRRLGTYYTGQAVQVRRSNDNATLDIGFTSEHNLDTVALKTFAGSGSAYVTRWYDQSGLGNDAFQATQSLQPRLVNAGVIDRLNGRPAIYFGTAHLATAQGVLFTNGASMTGVAQGLSTTPSAFVTKTGTSGGVNLAHPAPFEFTNTGGEFTVGNAATAQYNFISTQATNPVSSVKNAVGAVVYSFAIPTSGTYYNWVNGVQAGGNTVNAFSDGGNPLMIGNRTSGSSSGNLLTPELLLFNSVLTSNDRLILESAAKNYFLNNDASLTSLIPSHGALLPGFTTGITSYTAIMPTGVTLTPTASSSAASIRIRVNGGAYMDAVNRQASSGLSLNAGSNTIEVLVTAQDGTQRTYTITATRSNTLDVLGLSASRSAIPAYSLRRLSSGYTGAAVQVRRGTDHLVQDIGFTASGDLDTAALKAFIGTADGFVTRWYDQSGFGVDASQGASALQPRLVTAGIVERLHGKPAIYFGTANLATPNMVLFTNGASLVGVARGLTDTSSTLASKTGNSNFQHGAAPAPFDYSNKTSDFVVGDASIPTWNSVNVRGGSVDAGVRDSTGTAVFGFVIPATPGANYRHFLNGTLAGANPVQAFADRGLALRIGNRNDGSGYGFMRTPELVFFNDAIPDADRVAVENAQKSYYIIPCIQVAITTQPTALISCLGASASLTAVASGTSPQFKWLRDGIDIGVYNATLSLSNISAANAGTYSVLVSNACSYTVSNGALLQVPSVNYTPPVPAVGGGRQVCAGNSATLTASGLGGAVYRWYDAATGGNLLAQSVTYTTAALTSSTHFYVTQSLCGVEGPRRDEYVVVSPAPSLVQPASVAASPATICQRDSSALSATVDAATDQRVYWYDAPTGGNLLGFTASGAPFVVKPTSTKTYYAQSKVVTETRAFAFTGGMQTFTVPDGVTSIRVDARGAGSGGRPSFGGRVEATLSVYPGQVLNLYVGGAGGWAGDYNYTPGGFNGGGGSGYYGETGGGATDIRMNGTSLTDRVLVAGGAGGGRASDGGGGHGGGLVAEGGSWGSSGWNGIGGGGTQTEGGAAGNRFGLYFGNPGSFGQGGNAGTWGGWAGAGGGGWYGGGGSVYGGGGGGSSYTDPSLTSSVTHAIGFQPGAGALYLSFVRGSDCGSETRVPVTVTVNPVPAVVVPADLFSCPNYPVTLTASGADTYTWTPTNTTGASVTVSPAATTTYEVTGMFTATGCRDTAQTKVKITFAATGATVCANSTATLTASGADTYVWNPGGLTGASVQVQPSVTTVYTVTGTNAGGCSASIDVTAVAIPQPVVSAGADQVISAGSMVTLTASGADSYVWAPYYSGTATLNVVPVATTQYWVTGTDAVTGCQATDTVLVTLQSVPEIVGATTVCYNGTTTLTASGTGAFNWYDAASGGNLLFTGDSYTTAPITATTSLWVAGASGKRIEVKLSVSKGSPAVSSAEICSGETAYLINRISGVSTAWYDAPIGGNLLQAAFPDSAFATNPTTTTTYYAQSATNVASLQFNYTGGMQTFTVPEGVTSIQVDARGGGSTGRPSYGGRVQATLNVTPGQVLNLYVGGAGGWAGDYTYTPGGFNGGGGSGYYGETGGGATDIRIGNTSLTNRVLVAGGAGGGRASDGGGGHGGGLIGQGGAFGSAGSAGTGGGGSQTDGGSRGNRFNLYYGNTGSFGQGGDAGSWGGWGGAGGGGWYGGGGSVYGGGGGGSSFTNPNLTQNVRHAQGYQEGAGLLIISYQATCPAGERTPVVVTVKTPPTISIVASADTVCTSVQLTASGASTYTWNAYPGYTTGAKVLAGLRRLMSGYTGPIVQIRRLSDNRVADFGLLGNILDTAAVRAFLASSDGFCTKLYDQSGNGNHLVQAEEQKQPQLILNAVNGKPVLRFSAIPGRYMTSPVVVAAPYTVVYAARQTGPARGRVLSSIPGNWLLGWYGGNKSMAHFDAWISPSGGIGADSQPYVYSATRSSTVSRIFENGSLLYTSGSGAAGINGLQVNGYQAQPYELSDVDFGDVSIYDGVAPDAVRAALETTAASWYGAAATSTGSPVTFSPAGPTTTYEAIGTAANGCKAGATKVIVVDGKPPVVQCAADQALILNASCQATMPDYRSLLTITDNCSASNELVITQLPAPGSVVVGMDTIQVSFTVLDVATNSSTCSLRVIPRDTSTIRLICPATQTVSQQVGQCGAVVTLTAPTASNCRLVTVAQTGGPASGSLFSVGTTTVTYTATDAVGNMTTCSQNVVVTPLAYAIVGDTIVCSSSTASVSIANLLPGTTVNWYTATGGGGTLVTTGNPATNLGAGTYYASFNAPCGPVEKQVNIFDASTIPVVIAGDTAYCAGNRGFLSASGFGTVNWGQMTLPGDAASTSVAVGLRLLRTGYSGPLVRLRRSSDNAEENFGAVGGQLDTAAIRTWVGNNDAYCMVLYDQSGSGFNIIQTTLGAQPKFIFKSTANNRPTLLFNPAQYMQLAQNFNSPYTISVVARQTGGVRGRVLSSVSNNWLLGWHGGQEGKAYFEGWVRQDGPAAGNSLKVYTGTSNGSIASFYENGLLRASNGGGLQGPAGIQLNGFQGGSERSDCEIFELLVYPTVLSEASLVTVESGLLNHHVDGSRLLIPATTSGPDATYTAYSQTAQCGPLQSASITVHSAVTSNPATFGDSAWTVHVWNAGGALVNTATWDSAYSGYYTATGLNFNSAAQWASGTAPSGASGYIGCPVGTSNNSWSAKRKGFPCGEYKLSITSHDDAAQLWINGVKVWEHDICCDVHNNIWQGRLSFTDSIEFRVTQGGGGSHGALSFTLVPYTVTLSYPVTSLCRDASTLMPTRSQPGGRFSALPAGLSIDPVTGAINVAASSGGIYTITYAWANPCGDTVRATAPLTVTAPQLLASEFGNNAWNVSVWNTGGSNINSSAWNTGYVGHYPATGMNFNSFNEWPSGIPSSAPGYQGCVVSANNHSWSAKRRGFPCGEYKLSIGSHDDAAQLWINGVKVWEHDACCDSHNDVWQGRLGATDSVEFRVTQGTGGSVGSLTFANVFDGLTLSYPATVSCSNAADLSPTTNRAGAAFSASPAGLAINATTGLVQVSGSLAGTYTVTATWYNACSDAFTATAPVTILPQQGDPSGWGQGQWNVYVYRGGDGTIANAWTTGYSGYYTATGIDFNSTQQWAANASPSDAPGYLGCPVGVDFNSWSAKREGFPCGFYRISIPGHDDGAQLWINGVKVWEHEGCCDNHNDIWEGPLGPTDKVEFRVVEIDNAAHGSITITAGGPLVRYGAADYCSSAPASSPILLTTGGVFSAQPAGLTLDPLTGVFDPGTSTAGSYTVTYAIAGPCADSVRGTTTVNIVGAPGNPAVPGTNSWKVYVFGAGGMQYDTTAAWNSAYAGYLDISGLSFNTRTDWQYALYNASGVAGYQGCPVSNGNHSVAFRRKGFTCGQYIIRMRRIIGSAQLRINGAIVRYFAPTVAFNTPNAEVWRGYLNDGSIVDLMIRSSGGTYAEFTVEPIVESISLSYTHSQVCSNFDTLRAQLSGRNGGIYSVTPAGLTLDTSTGAVVPSTSTPGSYTITYALPTGCGDTLTSSFAMSVGTGAGDPSVFGTDAWNVYVYNSGQALITPASWSANYSGFYSASGLNFNSEAQWTNGAPPSDAPGYQGCPVGPFNNSWTAKRKGFTCGYYSINVDGHDDGAQLWVNGLKVWEHDACCDSHPDAWHGLLGSGDSVEFRVTQGGGGAFGAITFQTSAPTVTYPNSLFCSSEALQTPTVALSGGTFSATPAGLAINATTGEVTPSASSAGNYTITYEVNAGCAGILQSTTTLAVTAPGGDPTVPGTDRWNVYLWNAGNGNDPTHSWNTGYSGYVASTTSTTTTFNFISGSNPSMLNGYAGCAVTGTNYSWSMMRKGFACGRYSISFPTQFGSAEVRINGVLIRTFGEQDYFTSSVWQGYLSADDVIEVRVRSISGYGSRIRILFQNIGESMSLSYSYRGCLQTGSSDTLSPVISGRNGGAFTATPAGLDINPTTGVISLLNSLPGTYNVNYNGASVCGTPYNVNTSITVSAAPSGNPAIFGQGLWNVYAWNAGMNYGVAWNTGYAGYYTENSLSFNTGDRWDGGASPSAASGYQGCTVDADQHSWSAKRKGFPCGYYQINIPTHDDDAELWINGVRVFEHAGCCDLHTNVWSGALGAEDSVEYRVKEGGGGSGGAIELVLQSAISFSAWTGAVDRDWTNAGNWCGPLPIATTDVSIPAVANLPIVPAGQSAMVRNLTVGSGASLTVLGTLNLYSNLENRGGMLDMSLGRLDLEGASAQQVPAFMVQTLNVNGGGGFTLSGNSTVSGTLHFGASGGHVLLGASDLTVGTVSGGDENAFVVTNGSGALVRLALNGTQLMPVGVNSASYTPLTITNTDGLGWSVRLQGDFTGYPTVNQAAALPRIWHITPSTSPTITPTDLVFTYPEALWQTPSLVSVYHYGAGTGWALANNNASGLTASLANGLRSVTLSGQQAFSPFAISGITAPLPVTLLSFAGRAEATHNKLEWRTASEQNNRGFYVERSTDGRSFLSTAFVPGAPGGNSSTLKQYGFADSTFTGTRQYYRLRQEDFDGRFRYSQVVMIDRSKEAAQMTVYPNPAPSQTNARLVLAQAGPYTFVLLDAQGRQVRSMSYRLPVGTSTTKLELNGLAAGTYLLQVRNKLGEVAGTARLVKE
ncbi:MAG: HYR domain-containing protein [Chitinophagaceae bacterium]|nr:MAG: HYR domain-containing protein [Chitinophagaceae bacterium]